MNMNINNINKSKLFISRIILLISLNNIYGLLRIFPFNQVLRKCCLYQNT